MDDMKVLVITRSPWRDDNNTGNTMTDIFKGWDKNNIANLYCRGEMPKNNVCKKYYSISDKELIESIINPNKHVGREFTSEENHSSKSVQNPNDIFEGFLYMRIKKVRLTIFYWIQEIIWFLGRWKNQGFDDFLTNFDADIIFMPGFQSIYSHRLMWYAQTKMRSSVVLFHADDHVTMKQFSLSPFFWLYRILCRTVIRKSVKKSDLNYCISQKQVNEYSNIFSAEFKVLYKFDRFSGNIPINNDIKKPIKLVYTGNVNLGRWKVLEKIGNVLEEINEDEIKAQLDIYTLTPLTKKMRRSLTDNRNTFLKGYVDKVVEVQREADILVHVESFSLKEKLQVRLSFSTKIVDYFKRARCLFAVGWEELASIDYLIRNDAAIVATKPDAIGKKLRMLINNPEMVIEYGYKGWMCGKRNHNIEKIQKGFFNDLSFIV